MPSQQVSPAVIQKAQITKALMPDAEVTICGSWVWVTGSNPQYAERLRSLGYRFSRAKSKWYCGNMRFRHERPGIPWGQIVSRYGAARVVPVDQSPEPQAQPA